MRERAADGVALEGAEAGVASGLRYRLSQQQLVSAFGRFALKAHKVEDLLQEATRVSAEGLQTKLSKIMEYLPNEGRLVVRAGIGWKPGVVGQARVSADANSPTGYAYQSGEPIISNHLSTESRFRIPKLLEEHGVERAINVLIQSDNNRFGILEVDSTNAGEFTEADSEFLEALANLIGLAIDKQKAEEQLKRSVEHQELMNAEIGHRVKNSLAIVAALLGMQSRASRDPGLRSALAAAESRVHMIADVHDRLWRNSNVATVELTGFVGDLCRRLAGSADGYDVRCNIVPVEVSTEKAVSLGLLINELVTNAFKYAYPDGSGVVDVSIIDVNGAQLRLDVSDRGIGLQISSHGIASDSLGMRLIKSLARQLGGTVGWEDAQPGTRFVLVFPN
jgi:two-component sensor histidine kinase